MKKILFIIFILMLITSAVSFFGCNGKNNDEVEDELKIRFVDEDIIISPYQEYDVDSFVVHEVGVEYSYSGVYLTSKGAMKEIKFNGTKIIIPANDVVAEITVCAKKDEDIKEEILTISVQGESDKIDAGFKQLYKDDSISKNLNFNPKYIKDGKSSLKVTFNGYYQEYGTQFANLPGHLSTQEEGIYDTNYYSIYREADVNEAWKDAVMYFWVYFDTAPTECVNPVLDLGYRFLTRDGTTINLDFTQTPVTSIEQKKWTLFTIRFKDICQTEDLYLNVDDYYYWATYDGSFDQLNFKCRLKDSAYSNPDNPVLYNYSFYIDGINITTYDKFNEQFPDYMWGSDYGATWDEKLVIENWKNSGKGISVEFTLKDELLSSNTFALFSKVFVPGDPNIPNSNDRYEWIRLSDYIVIDFNSGVATKGKLINFQNGKYRYELMMDDVDENPIIGEEPTGNETMSLIYFNGYFNKLFVTEFNIIDSYS